MKPRRDYDSVVVCVPFLRVLCPFGLQATEQPTRTKNNPTDFCDGTAQIDSKAGVPSRGQRVLLTRIRTLRLAIQVARSEKI